MNLDWKGIVRGVAPILGTALGGPLGGAATKFIADKFLGNPSATQDEVAAALAQATPEQLLKLKELDNSFAIEMGKQGIDIYSLEVSDRSSAREREVSITKATGSRDYLPSILAVLVVAGFFSAIIMLMGYQQNPNNKDILYMMLGVLGTVFNSVYNYYFGSSSGSRNKDSLINTLSQK